jgi:hypothetical protein
MHPDCGFRHRSMDDQALNEVVLVFWTEKRRFFR